MVLGWILGCVNFETDRTRIGGWGVGGCTTPVFSLFMGFSGQKYPPYISVKKSAISYLWRIIEHTGNNHYFPGYISHLDTFRKVSSQDTPAYHSAILLSFYNNSNILFDIHQYHIWYTVSISRTYRHICTLYADVIINAYGYDRNDGSSITMRYWTVQLTHAILWSQGWGTAATRTHNPDIVKAGGTKKAHTANVP